MSGKQAHASWIRFGAQFLVLLYAGAAHAAVSNLAADFSLTNGNPNGVWSYGYMNAGGFTHNNLSFLTTGANNGFVAYDDPTKNAGGGGGAGWSTGFGFPFAGVWTVPPNVGSLAPFPSLVDFPTAEGDNPAYPNGVLGGHAPNCSFCSGWYAVKYTAQTGGLVDLEMKSWQTAIYPNVPPNPSFGGATRPHQIRIQKVVGATATDLVVAPQVTRHGVVNLTGTPQYTAANAPTPGSAETFATPQDELNAAIRSSAHPNLYRLAGVNLNAGESLIISYAGYQGENHIGFNGLNVQVRSGADRVATSRWDLSDDWSAHGTTSVGIGPDGAWSYGILRNGSFAAYDRPLFGSLPDDPSGTLTSHRWGTQERGWFLNGVTDPAEGPLLPGMVKDSDGFNLTSITSGGQFTGANGDWSGGKVALHTPTAEVDAAQTSVLRWTAPRNMTVDANGGMWRLTLPDATDRRHQYELRKGATVLASGTIDELGFGPTDTNSANPEEFSVSNIAVNAGDVLELRISPLSSGGAVTANFDNTGGVDGGDFSDWKTNFGTGSGADADGDLDSDGADFLAWQREFGATGGGADATPSFIGVDFTVQASGAGVGVPEPASAILLAFAAAALGRRRAR